MPRTPHALIACLTLALASHAPAQPPAPEAPPPARSEQAYTLPRPDGFTLPSGVRVLVFPRPGPPVVHGTLLVRPPGPALVDPRVAGLPALLADVLVEGAGVRDAGEFLAAAQALGVEIVGAAGYDHMRLDLTSPAPAFADAAALWVEALRRPRLTGSAFERAKRLRMDELSGEMLDPSLVAPRAARRYLLGDEHAYALPVGGLRHTLEPLTVEQARALHAAILRPEHLTVLLAGDVTPDQARAVLGPLLEDFPSQPPAEVHPAPFSGQSQTFIPSHPRRGPAQGVGLRVGVVDRPGTPLATLALCLPNVNFADASRPYRQVLGAVLGGPGTGRLDRRLRGELGWSTRSDAAFEMLSGGGLLLSSTRVSVDRAGATLRELIEQINRVRGADITDAEALGAQRSLRTDMIAAFNGPRGPIDATVPYLLADKPAGQLGEDAAELARATGFMLNRMAGDAIPLERGVLVIVGDMARIVDQLAPLNLGPIVELTPEGIPQAPPEPVPGSEPAPAPEPAEQSQPAQSP